MKLSFAIPGWLMKEYLTELGASETDPNVLVADGWQAEVRRKAPIRVGSLVQGQIEVEFFGDKAAIERILAKLELKTFRAGG